MTKFYDANKSEGEKLSLNIRSILGNILLFSTNRYINCIIINYYENKINILFGTKIFRKINEISNSWYSENNVFKPSEKIWLYHKSSLFISGLYKHKIWMFLLFPVKYFVECSYQILQIQLVTIWSFGFAFYLLLHLFCGLIVIHFYCHIFYIDFLPLYQNFI